MKVLRMVRNLVLLVLGVILCAILALAFLGWQMYTQALEATPLDQKVKQVRAQENYTTFAELPETYVDAVIAAEDHRFYQHNGIDVIAIGRAVVNDIKAMSFVEGGSTITQQLAKNQYFTQEQTIERKVAEVFMALTMEQHFSKRTILELYVNSIYFGDGHTGIGPASEGYFGKRPADLTADECTLLAGIPNAPSAYALSEHSELARKRQEHVLEKLVAYDYLERGDARLIVARAAAKEPPAWQSA